MKKALHIFVCLIALVALCLASPMETKAAGATSSATTQAVTITTQPVSKTVKAGDTVKFSVKATGTGLKYQWQTSPNGTGWSNCTSSTAKKATLTFTATTAPGNGIFRCMITDADGNVVYTDAVRLHVLGVVVQPKTQKEKAGDAVTFTVQASGKSLKYQWQSSADGETWKNCVSSTAKKATFTFTAKTSHSSNYYRCKITDANGKVIYTKEVRLYVLGVTTQPKTAKVEVGEKVTYKVAATGASKKYQWQSSADGVTWKNCVSSSATSATFTFTSKTSHSSNYYRCRIKDSGGNVVYTDAVRLYVLGVTKQPVGKTVEAGDAVKLVVKATGASKKYQWQSSADGVTWKNCVSSSAKKATFTFTGKTSHNGNYYRCRIKDSGGNVVYTDTVRLYVLGITEQPVSKVVTVGKTVKFEVAATGNGLKYQWQSSKDGTTWEDSTLASATEATFTFTGKSGHSGNYYRCQITDDAGNVIYTIKVKLTISKQDPEWSDSTDTIWR